MKFFKRYKDILLTGVKLFLAVSILTTGGILVWASTFNIPDLQSFEERVITQSTKIFDRTGEVLLFELHDDIRRTVIPIDQISENMIDATLAIEDSEFYSHPGIKPTAIVRAALVNLGTLDFSQGGSTITQQVVKNSVLTSEKKISRKIKEWILALKLDRQLSKDRILELYLNEIPYGGNLYGVEEAAQYYFDTSAEDLTVTQSAYLAALPKAPTYYSPYGNHRDALEQRKNIVLREMYQNNFITKDEYNTARNEEVTFIQHGDTNIKAPHFVFYIREKLEEKFGPEAVKEQGFRVITSLDWELQQKAEEIVAKYAEENTENFNARNAGMIAIDPQNGEILTMVGSRDYFDSEIDGSFNVTLANRQPGSAFKPFVYATAIKEGYTSETVLFDTQTQFSTACEPNNFTSEGDCYSPQNYDNRFRGPVTFREALAQSINVPAVKALYLTGVNDALQTAQDLGISSLEGQNRYGLTLVLGGGEVSLLEMTSAYGVFANEGVRVDETGILEIQDSNKNTLEKHEVSNERVLDADVSRVISDILSDNNARAPAFGENSHLYFPGRDVAAKTGTTNDYRDAWIIGYTPNIAVGAWAGNNNNESMEKRVAGFIVAPMWNEFMSEILPQRDREIFVDPNPIPQDIKPVLRGIWRGGRSEIISSDNGSTTIEEIDGGVHSILHWVDKDNPRGPQPTQPSRDPQYQLWEPPVRRWAQQNGVEEEVITNEIQHFSREETRIELDGLRNEYKKGGEVSFKVVSTNSVPLKRMDVFINNEHIGSASGEGTELEYDFFLNENYLQPQDNVLRVIVEDARRHTIEKEQNLSIQ